MRYPQWLPSPLCLFKALLLQIGFALLSVCLQVSGRFLYNLFKISFPGDEQLSWEGWWLLIVAFILPVWFFGHIHQFLWGKPNPHLPKWMPSWRSLGEGLWDWLVGVASLGFVAWVYLVYHDFHPPEIYLNAHAFPRSPEIFPVAYPLSGDLELPSEGKMYAVVLSCFMTAAYLYQL